MAAKSGPDEHPFLWYRIISFYFDCLRTYWKLAELSSRKSALVKAP